MKNIQIRCFQDHMGKQNHWKTTRPNEKVLLGCIALFGRFGWLRFGQFSVRALFCAVAAVLPQPRRGSRRSPRGSQRESAGLSGTQRKSAEVSGSQRKSAQVSASQRKSSQVSASHRKSAIPKAETLHKAKEGYIGILKIWRSPKYIRV